MTAYIPKWELNLRKNKEDIAKEWIPAKVPGAIQLDAVRAYDYQDIAYGDNYHQLDWMEDFWAEYRAELPKEWTGENVVLCGGGIDYKYEIYLNDTKLYAYEGMFRPFEIPLSEGRKERGNVLRVLIAPPPKIAGKAEREHASRSVKPAVCYGWDFHPPVIVRGIWEEIRLERRENCFIEEWDVEFLLNEDRTLGTIHAAGGIGGAKSTSEPDSMGGTDAAGESVSVGRPDARGISCTLLVFDPEGSEAGKAVVCCDEGFDLSVEISLPRLWWPNGHGEQELYRIDLILEQRDREIDRKTFRKGFRTIRLVPNLTEQDKKTEEPKTRELPPLTFEVNGKRIFVKGTNWVCPTMFPGTLNREIYETQLGLVKDAHMNIVRCWGGAIVNKDCFYELCDEMGLLVWQEFPLACNNYVGLPEYLAVLETESAAIIKRLRKFTCLALWCGGNELFNLWSGMNDQAKALRLLNKNCLLYDEDRPFFPTSPLMGMGHGSYVFRNDLGEDVIQIMNRQTFAAYTEFGCPGASDEETLRQIIPEEEWNRIEPGTAWETHHAVRAWKINSWMDVHVIKDYFGENLSTEEIIAYSRLLQGIGYQTIFEEARRQAPRCSMALNWCFNEPWKTAANNSVLTASGKVKPAYYHIQSALRGELFSVRTNRFDFAPGEDIEAEIWFLSETECHLHGRAALELCSVELGRKETSNTQPGNEELYRVGTPVTMAEIPVSFNCFGENKKLLGLSVPLPEDLQGLFELRVRFVGEAGGCRENPDSVYILLARQG